MSNLHKNFNMLDSIVSAIEDLKNGKMIIVVDAHVLRLRPPAHWLDAYLLGRALLLER